MRSLAASTWRACAVGWFFGVGFRGEVVREMRGRLVCARVVAAACHELSFGTASLRARFLSPWDGGWSLPSGCSRGVCVACRLLVAFFLLLSSSFPFLIVCLFFLELGRVPCAPWAVDRGPWTVDLEL